MSEPNDPPSWPSPRGPWPEVIDPTRLYDHGRPWCANADAHPDRHDGYPDRDRHLPWHECRTSEAYVDGTRRDLDGASVGVSVYAAASFRFGQVRQPAVPPPPTRVVVETWDPTTEQPAQRLSFSPAEALRFARILLHISDDITFANASPDRCRASIPGACAV